MPNGRRSQDMLVTILLAFGAMTATVDGRAEEFLITPAGGQAAVSGDPAGGFVVTWVTPSGLDLRGRVFDPTRTPVGAEFEVGRGASYWTVGPQLAADGGGFSVTWENREYSFQTPVSASGLTRRFSAGGTALSPVVNFAANERRDWPGGVPFLSPSVAGSSTDARHLIVWIETRHHRPPAFVGRWFGSGGAAQGPRFQLARLPAAAERYPSTLRTALSLRGTLALLRVEHRKDLEGMTEQLLVQCSDSFGHQHGLVLASIRVGYEEFFAGIPDGAYYLATDPKGGFAASWTLRPNPLGEASATFLARFDDSCERTVPNSILARSPKTRVTKGLAFDGANNLFIVWQGGGRMFDATGQPYGATAQLGRYVEGVSGVAGGFVIAFAKGGTDAGLYGTFVSSPAN